MDTFLSGVELLARFDVALALLIGSVGGVIIGAIPGVGPAVAIAILLPATFSMEPLVGLTMLLGIYGSSMFGGALPAILINTPGTAVNALTTYDGHPMTKSGQALKALGLAYGASFLGGIISIVVLILFSPGAGEDRAHVRQPRDLPGGPARHRPGDHCPPRPDLRRRHAGRLRHLPRHGRPGTGEIHTALHLRPGMACFGC